MSGLSKAAIKLHAEAEELLKLDLLDDDQREFVLTNWQESATNINSASGAFFTPSDLACDVAIFTQGDTIIDLCAGIGGLGLWAWWKSDRRAQVTCVEINPSYVAVGRKIFPEARWVCASVETAASLGHFDSAVSNPPFGKTAQIASQRYRGEDDLAVVDIASDCAEHGTFILPTNSCPFEYGNRDGYLARPSVKYDRFHSATAIELICEPIATGYYLDQWRGVKPRVEVVSADFSVTRLARLPAQGLLGLAA